MREAIAQVENPKVKEVLEAPGASHGLEASLRSALIRELVDAANDPRGLARLLHKRSSSILERDLPQDQMEQFDEACAGRVSKLPVIRSEEHTSELQSPDHL